MFVLQKCEIVQCTECIGQIRQRIVRHRRIVDIGLRSAVCGALHIGVTANVILFIPHRLFTADKQQGVI